MLPDFKKMRECIRMFKKFEPNMDIFTFTWKSRRIKDYYSNDNIVGVSDNQIIFFHKEWNFGFIDDKLFVTKSDSVHTYRIDVFFKEFYDIDVPYDLDDWTDNDFLMAKMVM